MACLTQTKPSKIYLHAYELGHGGVAVSAIKLIHLLVQAVIGSTSEV